MHKLFNSCINFANFNKILLNNRQEMIFRNFNSQNKILENSNVSRKNCLGVIRKSGWQLPLKSRRK